MSREHVRIAWAINGWGPQAWLEALAKADPAMEIVTDAEPGDTSIRYAIAWKQTPGYLAGFPSLKAIFSAGAGVEHILNDATLPALPIVRVVNSDLANRMSEYVVWQALEHLRQGRAYRDLQARREWGNLAQPAAHALTVGVMGLGELGSDAARKLLALGFRVAGWSRTPKQVDGVECLSGAAGLDAFLGQTDILVVLLPLTAQTRGIIDMALLRKLKRMTPIGGPVLINAGRGGLQVETDILAALETGVLMAASLDVFQTEPLPADSPLWEHPRVFVTPHAAADSDPHAIVPKIARIIRAHEAGEALPDLVDRGAGY